MGSWGVKTFENDDALDWIYGLEQADDISAIEDTLRVITERGDEYMEVPEACAALAAAEVVAALHRAGSPDLPNEVQQWVNRQGPSKNRKLSQLALKAIERVLTDSELKDLWDESDSSAEWQTAIRDLEARLRLPKKNDQ